MQLQMRFEMDLPHAELVKNAEIDEKLNDFDSQKVQIAMHWCLDVALHALNYQSNHFHLILEYLPHLPLNLQDFHLIPHLN